MWRSSTANGRQRVLISSTISANVHTSCARTVIAFKKHIHRNTRARTWHPAFRPKSSSSAAVSAADTAAVMLMDRGYCPASAKCHRLIIVNELSLRLNQVKSSQRRSVTRSNKCLLMACLGCCKLGPGACDKPRSTNYSFKVHWL